MLKTDTNLCLRLLGSSISICFESFIAAALRVMLCFRAFLFWLPTRSFSASSEFSRSVWDIFALFWLLTWSLVSKLFWCLLLFVVDVNFCTIFFFFVRCCFFFSWNSSKLKDGKASIFFSKLKSLHKKMKIIHYTIF